MLKKLTFINFDNYMLNIKMFKIYSELNYIYLNFKNVSRY